ncbi:unnamed protein product [Closterium sp. NIES-64]|nr:unnamed protein product [Closterium sp. NIES-64]
MAARQRDVSVQQHSNRPCIFHNRSQFSKRQEGELFEGRTRESHKATEPEKKKGSVRASGWGDHDNGDERRDDKRQQRMGGAAGGGDRCGKEHLGSRDHASLPVGKYGRDDEAMLRWFLHAPILFLSPLFPNSPSAGRRGEEHLGAQPCVPPGGRLVDEVKSILARDHASLPVGEYGRDDEAMLRWFLKDRKYKVEPTVEKLVKAIKWRHEFGVAGLTAADVAEEGATGKAFLHEYADVDGRPVIVVVAAKHFPDSSRLVYSQQLCAYLIERAIERLPEGEVQFRGIFDLRGFTAKNTDLAFVKFMVLFVDAPFIVHPGCSLWTRPSSSSPRCSSSIPLPARPAPHTASHHFPPPQVLFVDAPFIFQPGWKVMKPLLKSYANLVSAEQMLTLKPPL